MTTVSQAAPGSSRNRPCPCGSGKRFKHCCGDMRTPATPLSYTTEMLQRDLTAALEAERRRDWEVSLAAARGVLEKVPNQRQALRTALRCKIQLQDYPGADALAGKLFHYFPHDAEVAADTAELRELQGDVAAAVELARKAIRLDPGQSRAHRLLGRTAMRHGDIGAAEVHLRQTLYASEGGDAGVAADLARVLSRMGYKAEAEHYFRISLSLRPDQPDTLLDWSGMEESRHDLVRARELLELAGRLDGAYPALPLQEAVLLGREDRAREALERLRDVDRVRLTPSDQVRFYFLRGRLRDRLRRYEDAFKDLSRANSLSVRLLGLRYDAGAQRERSEALKRFFTADNLAALPRAQPAAEEGKPVPVFLLGFPRSGAALANQALTMHPRITGGDELFCVPNVRDRIPAIAGLAVPYPEGLAGTAGKPETVYRLRREYWSMLELAGVLDPGATHFIDRLPLNEWDLGLIHLMLPEAKLVRIVRHPMDTVLSLYSHDIRHGGLCGFDLGHAAHQFVLTQELVSHYLAQLPVDVLTVRYEDLVSRHEETLRGITDFIGASWSPDCLRFHDNPACVRGPSYAALKEPLYDSGIGRHRHYTAELKGVLPMLRQWIDRLGYSLD